MVLHMVNTQCSNGKSELRFRIDDWMLFRGRLRVLLIPSLLQIGGECHYFGS